MTLLLLFSAPASSGGVSSGTAFQSFVEAGMFLGNWDIDDYITFTACTHDAGAAANADAVPSYAIYEDETAAPIVSGNMAQLGAVTGFYTERLQLTAAAGFETGKMYAVRIAAVMGGVTAAATHSFAVKVAAVNVTLWKGATAPAMTGDAYARLGAPAGASVSADIAAIAAASVAGSGAISFPVTINDASSNPIDGVEVWISTDSAGVSVVAGTLSTDALGVATFMLDAGTFYLWRQKSGYNFVNPVTIVVS